MPSASRTFPRIAVMVAALVIGQGVLHGQFPDPNKAEIQEQRKQEADLDRRTGDLRNLEKVPRERPIRRDYRAEREAWAILKEARSASPEDRTAYNGFLKRFHGGLFRLQADHDCATWASIRTDGVCAGFVDGASAYSFRAKGHLFTGKLPFQDIVLNNGNLKASGFFEHGFLASLGDVPLETVKLDDAVIRDVLAILPAKTLAEASAFTDDLAKGSMSGHSPFTNSISPQLNTTYVFRAIAYKPSGIDFNGQLTSAGMKYFALSWDPRMDLTVAFRVVGIEPDGSLTILWRELKRKKAPILNLKAEKNKYGH